MGDYGSDASTFGPDGLPRLDLDGPEITGVRVPLEGVARLIMTELGQLEHELSFGVSETLQDLVNSTHEATFIRGLESEWAQSARQVNGVLAAQVRILSFPNGHGFAIPIVVHLQEGTFPLQVLASDVITVLFPPTASVNA